MSNGNASTGATPSQTNTADRDDASTRDRALRAVEELGDNPVALLAGGVALGVLIGMVLPRIAREREMLDPLGRKFAERAAAAASAAKEAGRQEIDSLIPDRSDAKEKASAVFGHVLNAAKDAART